jgi:hypothetical protein
MLRDDARRAVWVHVRSDEQLHRYRLLARRAGWQVVAGTAQYFVVAVRRWLRPADRNALRRAARPYLVRATVRRLGALFGYPDKEIAWYLKASEPSRS